MSTEERPDSLASQAAAWVPPWDRRLSPDPAYAAATAGPVDVTDDPDDADPDDADPDDAESGDGDGDGDGDDADSESGTPEGDDVPPELPPIPGEIAGPAIVDAPQIRPDEDEPGPTDVGVPPDLPVPDALESAEQADTEHTESGLPVDAPVPADGNDAGGVFDGAADDIVDSLDGFGTSAAGAEPVGEPTGSAAPATGPGSGDADPSAVTARRRTPRKEEPPLPPIDDAELRAALEAILLVVDEPVGELQLADIMEQPVERVAATLEDLAAGYTAGGHGFDLRRAAGGWRLYTRSEYAPYVERFVLDGQSVRLTQAALETLAVVAYKQPVTRSRISVIRGVNCDGVMRTLVTRGLIEECGTESETGAYLYRTTALFLEKLGLDSVDQLPPLAPFLPDDVEEVLDAQR